MGLKYSQGCTLFSALSLLVINSVAAAPVAFAKKQRQKNEDTLVITASRSEESLWNSPATTQVIGQTGLQSSTNTSIADNLQDIPGVEITDNGLAGRKQIRIRGEASSRVLILIDGQEVTYQRSGQDYGVGLLIDESALERIEIVKGPYSVLYGSQAIGGVVNFITRKGGDTPMGGTVKAVYSSATAGWLESAAAWGQVGNFDYRINGSYSDQGNRDTPDGRLPDSPFRNNSQGVWLGYKLGSHKFGLSLDRFKLSTQTWYDDPGYEDFSVKLPKLEREKIALFYDFAVDGDYLKNLHLDAYSQTIERKFENNVTVNTPSGSPMIGNLRVVNQTHSQDKQYTQGLTLQSDFTLPAGNHLVLGAQYQRDRIKQTSNSATQSSSTTGFPAAVNNTQDTLSHNQAEQLNGSLFGQNEWQFADSWIWTIGARQYWYNSQLNSGDTWTSSSRFGNSYSTLDNHSVRDTQLLTASSLRYSALDNMELRLAFAQGYVFPTLTQLFMQTSAGGGINYGNPNLEAEHSSNYEFGVRYNGNLWYVDGAVYYSEAKDYIASIACAGQAVCAGNTNTSRTGYYYYDNVESAKTYGMELSAEYNGWAVSPYLSGNLMRRQYDGATLKTWNTGDPTLNGRLGIKHTLILNAINVTSDLYIRAASQAQNDTGTQSTHYAGWATLNLAFNTEFGSDDRYRINLTLNNLTNERYQTAHESIPAAGFNAAVGLLWRF